MSYDPKSLALHGVGEPADPLPPDPENAREVRAARARLAMLAGSPDLNPKDFESALSLLEASTEEPAGITVAGLLVDLAHFCDLKGYDFEQAFACAKELYLEDTADAGLQFSFPTD
jgi:hypothetical protein